MSVWFKYAGDKDITPGHPGGASMFSVPVVGGGGFPPAGSFNSLMDDISYPYGQGGTQTACLNPDTLNNSYADNQTCDLTIRNDGSGGTYEDWAGVTDIKYKVYGTFALAFTDIPNFIEISGNCTSTSLYPNGYKTATFYHDGIGGNYYAYTAYAYTAYGTLFFAEECWSEELGNYITNYFSDGNGSYYT